MPNLLGELSWKALWWKSRFLILLGFTNLFPLSNFEHLQVFPFQSELPSKGKKRKIIRKAIYNHNEKNTAPPQNPIFPDICLKTNNWFGKERRKEKNIVYQFFTFFWCIPWVFRHSKHIVRWTTSRIFQNPYSSWIFKIKI